MVFVQYFRYYRKSWNKQFLVIFLPVLFSLLPFFAKSKIEIFFLFCLKFQCSVYVIFPVSETLLRMFKIKIPFHQSGHRHPFTLMLLLRKFNMLDQCLVPSITKKSHFLLVGPVATISPLNIKFSIKCFNISQNPKNLIRENFILTCTFFFLNLRVSNIFGCTFVTFFRSYRLYFFSLKWLLLNEFAML